MRDFHFGEKYDIDFSESNISFHAWIIDNRDSFQIVLEF